MLTDVPAEWIITASDRLAVKRGYRWSESAIQHALDFAATLRDPMDAEKPYVFLKWQLAEVRKLFGWRRPDGRRRFTRLNYWIPKKDGKTSFLAFLGLYFLCVDGEKRPGCYVASATGKLAGELYDEAVALTQGTKWRRVLRYKDFTKTIMLPPSVGGRFESLAATAEGVQGLKGSFVCIDEIHATLKKKPKLYGALRYAGSGRNQPITATISTAGDDRQSKPYQIYRRAKQILAGQIIDLHTLCLVFEAEDKDEYTDADFLAANPAIGEILTLEQIREDYDEAKSSDHDFEDFKRYRLNVWTKRSTAWLDVGEWEKCGVDSSELPDLNGLDCFVGVDLSSRLDLTAAVAIYPLDDDRFYVRPMFWLPKKNIEERCIREMDYVGAADAGFMELTDGPLIDYGRVQAWIESLGETANVRTVGFDPHRAGEIAKLLELAGFECFKVLQGWNLSEPMHKVEAAIEARHVLHDNNPVLSWCVENTETRTDNNGKIRPVKPVEKYLRIDGVVGMVIGIYLAMFADEDAAVSQDEIDRQMGMILKASNGLS